MNDADLKSVAESMNLKKIDLSDKEGLIYRILDQQAIDRAASSTEEKKRRGRKASGEGTSTKSRGRKKAAAQQLAAEEQVEQQQAEQQQAEQQPVASTMEGAETPAPKNEAVHAKIPNPIQQTRSPNQRQPQ